MYQFLQNIYIYIYISIIHMYVVQPLKQGRILNRACTAAWISLAQKRSRAWQKMGRRLGGKHCDSQSLWFIYAYPCLSMFIYVYLCSSMFIYLYQCFPMFISVYLCLSMFISVYLCWSMSIYVDLCFFYVYLCLSNMGR